MFLFLLVFILAQSIYFLNTFILFLFIFIYSLPRAKKKQEQYPVLRMFVFLVKSLSLGIIQQRLNFPD